MGKNSQRKRHTREVRPGPVPVIRGRVVVAGRTGVRVDDTHVCPTDDFTVDEWVADWLAGLPGQGEVEAMVGGAVSAAVAAELLNGLDPPEPVVVLCRCEQGWPPVLVLGEESPWQIGGPDT